MRSLLSALVLALVGLAADVSAASAQEPGRVYKIAWLGPGDPPPFEKWTRVGGAFRDALRDRGFAVGKNLIVDVRTAQGDLSRLPALADALVATQPDVLVTVATASTVVAMRATKTIPIVFFTGIPVEKGIVKSLVDHGDNATGQTGYLLSFEKLWQLLRDAAPAVRRAGYVFYAPSLFDRSPEYRARRMAIRGSESAQAGFELVDLGVDRLEELEPKVAALANGGEAALFPVHDPTLFTWRAEIMSMAMRYRLPTACAGGLDWGNEGCLITQAADEPEMGRRAAAQVVKIFNGTNPADIPIEQPTIFKIIVNAKTAKALGLTLPPSLLALADEVIE
jgi:putative ABC transport system substrate-binding protein